MPSPTARFSLLALDEVPHAEGPLIGRIEAVLPPEDPEDLRLHRRSQRRVAGPHDQVVPRTGRRRWSGRWSYGITARSASGPLLLESWNFFLSTPTTRTASRRSSRSGRSGCSPSRRACRRVRCRGRPPAASAVHVALVDEPAALGRLHVPRRFVVRADSLEEGVVRSRPTERRRPSAVGHAAPVDVRESSGISRGRSSSTSRMRRPSREPGERLLVSPP